MLAPKNQKSYIFISTDIESVAENLEMDLKPSRVVKFIKDSFKIEHAKEVTKEAYISEAEIKYLILGAKEFTLVAQNSLLKILEEPPTNIRFIIISPTKSNLLPTVRSRMPIIKGDSSQEKINIDINLSKLDYADIFIFLKKHARTTKTEAKEILQALYYRATVTDMLVLSQEQLENFDKAYRLLELNSRVQSIFAMILMGFAK